MANGGRKNEYLKLKNVFGFFGEKSLDSFVDNFEHFRWMLVEARNNLTFHQWLFTKISFCNLSGQRFYLTQLVRVQTQGYYSNVWQKMDSNKCLNKKCILFENNVPVD